MKFETLPNGNLKFTLEGDADKLLVEDLLAVNGGDDIGFLASLLEDTGWQPNGRLHLVNPEDVAALTSAPILTDDLTVEDDGTVNVHGSVWWFPDYQVLHFGQVLLADGTVTFHAAPSVVEEPACA